jgi:hypothetical protein
MEHGAWSMDRKWLSACLPACRQHDGAEAEDRGEEVRYEHAELCGKQGILSIQISRILRSSL